MGLMGGLRPCYDDNRLQKFIIKIKEVNEVEIEE